MVGTLGRMMASRSSSLSSRLITRQKSSFNPKNITSSLLSSPPSMRSALPLASRVVSALGSVESLLPLHSATASARLRSSIGVDSSCWSFLSHDFAVPR